MFLDGIVSYRDCALLLLCQGDDVKGLLAVAGAHKAAATVVAVGVVFGVGSVVKAATDGSTTATVVKVVDGDTIDVKRDGDTYRVRLLNVNTPESVDPDKPVECLGPEASEWLKQRLPEGTEVRLEHDRETEDGYGRELAAVFDGEELINAEIARAGLGVPMSVGSNTKYLPPVQSAHVEAQTAGRGLYAADIQCTLPAQVQQLAASASGVTGQPPAAEAALGEFDSYAASLAAVASAADSLFRDLAGDPDVFPLVAYGRALSDYRGRVLVVQQSMSSATRSNDTARDARRRQLDADAQRAAEEAARAAAEEAARAAAEEAARQEAERAAAEAAAHAAERTPSTSGRSSSGGSTSHSTSSTPAPTAGPPPPSEGGGSGGPSGYTGCRSYAPGGETWTPIPC